MTHQLWIATCVLCVPTWAAIAPTPGTQNVTMLFDQSDLVCDCSVESVQMTGSEGADNDGGRVLHDVATLRVNKSYKSVATVSSSFNLEFENDQLVSGERAIMFLRSIGSSIYVLADPFLGATPFTFLPVESSDAGLQKLESTLANVVHQTTRDDQINAMKLLQGFSSLSPATISRLVPLSSSADPEIAFAAHAVLIKTGEVAHVESLRTYLRGYSADSAPSSILSIGTELGEIRDERALSALEELSGSKLLSIRIGAMQALRSMKSPAYAEAFVRRLDDSDGYIRYLAVISLAETFGKYGDFAPTMYLFDRNPAFYIGLWKSWLAEEGNNTTPALGRK